MQQISVMKRADRNPQPAPPRPIPQGEWPREILVVTNVQHHHHTEDMMDPFRVIDFRLGQFDREEQQDRRRQQAEGHRSETKISAQRSEHAESLLPYLRREL